MNEVSRGSEECWIASEGPAGRYRMSQAHGGSWRKTVAAVLLFVYGVLPAQALAEPPSLPSRPPLQVASLRVTPRAAITGPAAQEASLGRARPATLPQPSNTLNLMPPDLSPPAATTPPSHVTAMGRLPLAFIENQGQVDERAKFYVRSGNQTVWLTSEGLRFDLLRAKGGADSSKSDPARAPNADLRADPLNRLLDGGGQGRLGS